MLVEASRFEELFSEDKITPVAGIILGLGCFCFIVGFCGCCGAMKENICFLKTVGFIGKNYICVGNKSSGWERGWCEW